MLWKITPIAEVVDVEGGGGRSVGSDGLMQGLSTKQLYGLVVWDMSTAAGVRGIQGSLVFHKLRS